MNPARKILPMPEATDSEARLARMEALLNAVLDKTDTAAAPGTEITVADVAKRYLAEKGLQRTSGNFNDKGIDRIERRLESFVEKYGLRTVASCSNHEITEWVFEHPEWKSSHTKSDAAGVVVTCFYWAAEKRLIPYSPFRKPKGLWPAPEPRVAITPKQYRAIMQTAKESGYQRARIAFRRALFFLWRTGARTCEMRELRWQDIDFTTGIASLSEHKTAKATGQARLIALDAVTIRMMQWTRRRMRVLRQRDEHVFLNSQGRPWEVGSFAQYFRKIAKTAGVPLKISPYSLRHGFCVQGLENGVGERQLADIMGHATTRYISWYGRSTRRKGDYLRGVLGQVHGKKKPREE